MTHNLYLIHDPLTALYKIGITSQNVSKRINNLKRKYHHGDQLQLIHTVSSENAVLVEETEEALHTEYAEVQQQRKTWIITEDSAGKKHKRRVNLNGYTEWFLLNPCDIADVKFIMDEAPRG